MLEKGSQECVDSDINPCRANLRKNRQLRVVWLPGGILPDRDTLMLMTLDAAVSEGERLPTEYYIVLAGGRGKGFKPFFRVKLKEEDINKYLESLED